MIFLLLVTASFGTPLCETEIKTVCENKFIECLRNESLSIECREDLKRTLLLKKQSAERGGGSLTSFGGINAVGPQIPMVSYDGHLIPISFKGMSQSDNRLAVSTLLYQSGQESLALSGTAAQTHFGEPLTLNTGQTLSTTWSRIEIGAQYAHQNINKKSWSVKTSVGYAGDTPSGIPRDLSYSVMGTYGFEGSGTDYWVLLVMVANNSQLANYVPLPGFIYIHRTEHFTGLFGFPILSLQWTPIHATSLSLSIFGINAQAEIAYGESTRIFMGYGYLVQSFIPKDRLQDRDRLNIHEQKLGPGLRFPFNTSSMIEIQSGYSFDRSNSISTSVFRKDGGTMSLDSSWFANLSLKSAL